jgi:hypothetical protein
VFQKTRAIAGLLGLPSEEGTVIITKDPMFSGLMIEVFSRKTAASAELDRLVAVRSLTRKELDDLHELAILPQEESACYAWLGDLVEIRLSGDGCNALVHLRSYDDRPEKRFESLRADLRNMLDAQRDSIRSWQSISRKALSDSDLVRAEVLSAARRLGICAEKADALHEYFVRAGTSTDGSIDKQEFRAFLLNICCVRDQVCISEAKICRHWWELHAQAGHHKVGFTRFLAWLITKFPHVSDITAWQIRRFTRSHSCAPTSASGDTKDTLVAEGAQSLSATW